MQTKIFFSVDPGSSSGAWAALDQDCKYVECDDVKSVDGRVDVGALYNIMAFYKTMYDEIHVVVEDVHTMPGQGVASSGKFMRAAGAIEAIGTIIGDTFILVRPQVWKKHHGLIGTEKADSLELARRLWPDAPLARVKDHNRGDALLMAMWLGFIKSIGTN